MPWWSHRRAMAASVATLPITVGVGGIVERDGRVLCVRRTYGPSKGLWTIPSGYLEPGESLVQALERELHEETLIVARARPLVGVRNLVGPERNDGFLVFTMDSDPGEPQPDGQETSDAAFVSPAEIHGEGASTEFTRLAIDELRRSPGWSLHPFAQDGWPFPMSTTSCGPPAPKYRARFVFPVRHLRPRLEQAAKGQRVGRAMGAAAEIVC